MTTVTVRRLARPRDGRLVAGVCAGLGRSLRLDTSVVRFGFLALALAGGVGLGAYGLLWVVLPSSEEPNPPAITDWRDNAAALAVVAGCLLVLRSAGIWFSDAIAAVGGVAAVGIVLVWGRSDRAGAARPGRMGALRIAAGVVLAIVGFLAFVALTGDLQALGQSLVAALVAATGVALLAGPRLARLADELRAERRARVRSEERAEIAAHLHDGVLQTLALIQRQAGDNREVASLARRQERELREWLYGSGPPAGATLASELRRAMAAVEDDHRTRVELVCVGDTELDERASALVAATREAAANAARHAGADHVDVYVEVEDDEVSAFVRDRGRGFDPATVPDDRRGIADSIEARVRRAGGSAVLRTEPGRGTEVALRVPRGAP